MSTTGFVILAVFVIVFSVTAYYVVKHFGAGKQR